MFKAKEVLNEDTNMEDFGEARDPSEGFNEDQIDATTIYLKGDK